MLDGHDTLVCEKLFRVVVDQLAVDENVDVVLADLVNLSERKEEHWSILSPSGISKIATISNTAWNENNDSKT